MRTLGAVLKLIGFTLAFLVANLGFVFAGTLCMLILFLLMQTEQFLMRKGEKK